MYREAFLITDIGEIEHHRHTNKLITPLTHHGTTSRDYHLREMVVKRHPTHSYAP